MLMILGLVAIVVAFGMLYFTASPDTPVKRQTRTWGFVVGLIGLLIEVLTLYAKHPRWLVLIVIAAFALYVLVPAFRKQARGFVREGKREVRKAGTAAAQQFQERIKDH